MIMLRFSTPFKSSYPPEIYEKLFIITAVQLLLKPLYLYFIFYNTIPCGTKRNKKKWKKVSTKGDFDALQHVANIDHS